MSEPCSHTTRQPSMFSVEDFPANPTPLLADEKALKTSATYGLGSPESFATLDHDGSWRKTCQGYSQMTLDGSLEAYCETWPRSGMTRNGTAYQLQPSAPLTRETESGSWPTPRAVEWKANGYQQKGEDAWLTLTGAVRLWPTPQANDAIKVQMPEASVRKLWEKQKRRPRGAPASLSTQVLVRLPTPTAVTNTGGAAMCKWGGSGARARLREMFTETELNGALNPTWVEWLMGYPLGWTVCEGWGMRSSRRLRNGSAAGSSTRKKG